MKHLLVLTVAVLLAGCAPEAERLPVHNAVPAFALTAHTGGEFNSEDVLKGSVWVADFIFTTCHGPCPRMTSQMRRLQQDLAGVPNVKLVSFTVDPETDTPEVLAEYARQYGAEDGWYFLTGPRETLHQLNRHVFMLGDVQGNLDHSTRFVLVDAQGYIRGYYLSSEPEAMRRLEADVRALAAGGAQAVGRREGESGYSHPWASCAPFDMKMDAGGSVAGRYAKGTDCSVHFALRATGQSNPSPSRPFSRESPEFVRIPQSAAPQAALSSPSRPRSPGGPAEGP